jgi:CBS domain-containing protein
MTAETLEGLYAPEVDSIGSTEPASHAKRRMDTSEVRSLLVMDEGRLLGIIRRNSLLNLSIDELERPVADFMSHDVPKISHNQSVEEARAAIGDDINIAQVPVIDDNGEIVGVIERQQLHTASHHGGTTHDPDHVPARIPVEDGMTVKDASGSNLGKLAEADFKSDGNVEFMIIEHGLIFKKQKRLPGDLIKGVEGGDLHLSIDSTEFGMMKDIDEDA